MLSKGEWDRLFSNSFLEAFFEAMETRRRKRKPVEPKGEASDAVAPRSPMRVRLKKEEDEEKQSLGDEEEDEIIECETEGEEEEEEEEGSQRESDSGEANRRSTREGDAKQSKEDPEEEKARREEQLNREYGEDEQLEFPLERSKGYEKAVEELNDWKRVVQNIDTKIHLREMLERSSFEMLKSSSSSSSSSTTTSNAQDHSQHRNSKEGGGSGATKVKNEKATRSRGGAEEEVKKEGGVGGGGADEEEKEGGRGGEKEEEEYDYKCPMKKASHSMFYDYVTQKIMFFERLIRIVRCMKAIDQAAKKNAKVPSATEGNDTKGDDGGGGGGVGDGSSSSSSSSSYDPECPYGMIVCSLNMIMDGFVSLVLSMGRRGGEWKDKVHLRRSLLPDHSRSLYFGDIPDVSDVVLKINFWGFKKDNKNYFRQDKIKTRRRKSDISKDSLPLYDMVRGMKNNLAQDFMHFISKGLNRRCLVRSIIDCFNSIYAYDKTFLEFVKSIFLNTLLGLYPHCTSTPDFNFRVTTYGLLVYPRPGEKPDNILSKWIEEHHFSPKGPDNKVTKVFHNQGALCFMIREFLMFSVSYLNYLRDVLKETISWDTFENDTLRGCENMRSDVKHNSLHGLRFFTGVEENIFHIKKKNIYPGKRPSFNDTVLAQCEKTNINELYKLKKDASLRDQDALAKRMELVDFFYMRMARFATDGLRSFRLTGEVPETEERLSALLCEGLIPSMLVGILPALADQIEATRTAYEKTGKNAVIEKLVQENIKYAVPLDMRYLQYSAMYRYFRCANIVNNISKFPQPQDYYDATILALRKRFSVPDSWATDDDLVECLREKTSVTICLQCKRIRNPVVVLFSDKGITAAGSYVLLDTDTGLSYCAGKETTANDKKRGCKQGKVPPSYNLIREMDEIERRIRRADAKKDNKSEQTEACNNTPVITVDILGYFLNFFGDNYMLCPKCGSLTVFDKRYPYMDMYTCNCCKRNKAFLSDYTVDCIYCHTKVQTNDPKLGKYILEVNRTTREQRLYQPSRNPDVARLLLEQQREHSDVNIDTVYRYVSDSPSKAFHNARESERLPNKLLYPIHLCSLHNKRWIERVSDGGLVFLSDILTGKAEAMKKFNAENKNNNNNNNKKAKL